jgi:hypothetical protein
LQTEREMHNAWRKRAEEAEAKLDSTTERGVKAGMEAAAKLADKMSDPITVVEVMPSCESPLSVAVVTLEIAKAIRLLDPKAIASTLEGK